MRNRLFSRALWRSAHSAWRVMQQSAAIETNTPKPRFMAPLQPCISAHSWHNWHNKGQQSTVNRNCQALDSLVVAHGSWLSVVENPGLKIPRRVIPACRFESGPGHKISNQRLWTGGGSEGAATGDEQACKRQQQQGA